MSKKRKTWRDDLCSCGEPVTFRAQYDMRRCQKIECTDKAFESIGYVPSPENLRRRAEKKAARG